eukprot:CAMPEP_0113524684 /NCGR_PEP_ID=MMETSP0014_2-20120614/46344_1 /TAXON_ID=2857 /ORGANISM="Nitzschia sp." /LENGTH=512 /DNA_ID=CAMNT_0000422805 /DNA_START=107 /DNA_END=1641 /DNA_ORIENTATION=+ /assembly_acc=CAM_ASM_000159
MNPIDEMDSGPGPATMEYHQKRILKRRGQELEEQEQNLCSYSYDMTATTTRRRRRPYRTHATTSKPSSSPLFSPLQRHVAIFLTAACMLLYSIHFVPKTADAFGPQHHRHQSKMIRIRSSSQGRSSSLPFILPTLCASKIDHDTDGKETAQETWSKPASTNKKRSGSPLQVRRRVRAVLEKARTRTGVQVKSSSRRGAPSVVAEAASIGGLGVDGPADLVVDTTSSSSKNIVNGTSDPNQPPSSDSDVPTPSVLSDEELSLGRINGVAKQSNRVSSPAEESSAGSSNMPEEVSTEIPARKPKDFDVIRGDVPAANRFVEPLPFELPKLSAEQKKQLLEGERVQEQSRMGREGSGFVVLDVKAPPFVVWECLLDFENYPDIIPTVREMQLYTSEKLKFGYVNEKPVVPGTGRETRHYGIPSVTRASFVLSKFRLNIAAVHRYTPHPNGDYMEFTLDKSCTNMVLKGAKGIWYTEENPEGREGYTRVYLLASLQISRALPTFIVDYAAVRAMPR